MQADKVTACLEMWLKENNTISWAIMELWAAPESRNLEAIVTRACVFISHIYSGFCFENSHFSQYSDDMGAQCSKMFYNQVHQGRE